MQGTFSVGGLIHKIDIVSLMTSLCVPQGSVPGSILFSMYVSPLYDIARRCGVEIHQYANDCQLYIHLRANDCSDTSTRT